MRNHGRASVSIKVPRPFAICDSCGFLHNHDDLRYQYQFAGTSLTKINHLVCQKCRDRPQHQMRAIALPQDPPPIFNPRPQDYYAAATNNRATSGQNTIDPVTGIPIPGTTILVAQDGSEFVTQSVGEPPGGRNYEPGTSSTAVTPLYGVTHYGVLIKVLSMVSDATVGLTITVTCSAAHGLSTNGQISVAGTSVEAADGAFSVIVVSPMAFTYQLPIATSINNSILSTATVVKTILVGLPYGMVQIPSTGALR